MVWSRLYAYRRDLGDDMAPGEYVLVCAAESLRPAGAAKGLELIRLGVDSPVAAIQENMSINERAFDPAAAPVSFEAAEAFRGRLHDASVITARLAGTPVAAGMRLPVRDAVAELAGIGTLPGYRGRGYGAAVTTALALDAFKHGAELLFVTTDNPAAQRVYVRVGFTGLTDPR